ncbi:MAG: SDR family oxidoreductase [Ardenticatenaceae bacterium]|nr:SDR family oxidoreductase [Ardenticatenaceae bacterium]MCB9446213.1 SDR family oxidoreductase [Ardenticatenaceae bacterium]
MNEQVCLITGGNTGIGLATAIGLAQLGVHIVIVSRDRNRGETAVTQIKQAANNTHVDLLVADLSSQAQIRRLADEFLERNNRLDVLVNNAGVIPQTRQVTEDGYELQFAVNHLAYFLLTNLLLDLIKASAPARIVNVSSQVHAWATIDFDDLQNERRYNPTGVYGQTKLMNVLFTYELARRLEGTAVTANCLHPGVISTNLNAAYMGRSQDMASMSQLMDGAQTSIYLASSPEVEGVTGKYFSHQRTQRSADLSYDESVAAKLWQISARMTGLAV